jgi:hypothetical protein
MHVSEFVSLDECLIIKRQPIPIRFESWDYAVAEIEFLLKSRP